jgi:hypothetical protein
MAQNDTARLAGMRAQITAEGETLTILGLPASILMYMSFSIPPHTSCHPVGNSYLPSTASAFESWYSKPSVADGPVLIFFAPS